MTDAIVALPIAVIAVAIMLAAFGNLAIVALAVIALVPLGEQVIATSPVAVQVVDLTGVAAVALVVLVRTWRSQAPLAIRPASLWLLLLAAAAMASTVGSLDVVLSVHQVVQLVAGILLALAVASAIDHPRDRLMILVVFAVMGAAVCAYTLITTPDIREIDSDPSLLRNRATGIFEQPNNFGCFAAAVFVAGMAVMMSGASRWITRCGALCACLGAAGIGVALSRGSMIGAGLAIAGFVVLVPRYRARIVATGIVGVALLAGAGQLHVGPDAVQLAGSRLVTIVTGNQNPYDERPAIWSEALHEIAVHPLLGTGPNTFPIASARERPSGVSVSVSRQSDPDRPVLIGAEHAHNVILTIGAEIGVFGMVAAVGFTISLGIGLWRARTRLTAPADRAVLAGIAGVLLIFVGQGIVDFTLRDPVLATTLWLFVGLALNVHAPTLHAPTLRAPSLDVGAVAADSRQRRTSPSPTAMLPGTPQSLRSR